MRNRAGSTGRGPEIVRSHVVMLNKIDEDSKRLPLKVRHQSIATDRSGTGGTTSNNGTIAWSTSTASWGNVQSAGWTDASTAGNRWICINLTAALNVTGAGFTVSFPAAALTFQIDN